MTKKEKFWLGTTLTLIAILIVLLIGGCYPDNPPVARTGFDGIEAGSVNSQGANDGANSRPEGNLYLGHWARWKCADESVKLGNVQLQIDTTYYWQSGAVTAGEHKTIWSNGKGYFTWNVLCQSPVRGSFRVDYECNIGSPRCSTDIGGTFARVDSVSKTPDYMEPIDYMAHSYNYNYQGSYWASGSDVRDGNLSAGQLKPNPRPRTSNLTNSDDTFLQNPHTTTDFVKVSASQWQVLSVKDDGNYQVEPATHFEPIDDFRGEPNYVQSITDNSTPYFLKWQFITIDGKALSGRIFTGQMSIGEPNEPNYIEPVQIEVIADSSDLKSHIAVSEYIVVADPNGYAPFHVGDIFVVPLGTGQIMKVDFADYSQIIDLIAPHWLTSCAMLDKNHDGKVNYKDLQ